MNKVMNFGDSSHKTVKMRECFWSSGAKWPPSVGIGFINLLFSFLDIEEKTNPNLCTYVNTGNSFLVQEYFHCITCCLDEKKHEGACKICVKICHAGHDVRFAKNDRFYCDCGAEGEKSCNSLLKKQSSMYIYPYQFQNFYPHFFCNTIGKVIITTGEPWPYLRIAFFHHWSF